MYAAVSLDQVIDRLPTAGDSAESKEIVEHAKRALLQRAARWGVWRRSASAKSTHQAAPGSGLGRARVAAVPASKRGKRRAHWSAEQPLGAKQVAVGNGGAHSLARRAVLLDQLYPGREDEHAARLLPSVLLLRTSFCGKGPGLGAGLLFNGDSDYSDERIRVLSPVLLEHAQGIVGTVRGRASEYSGSKLCNKQEALRVRCLQYTKQMAQRKAALEAFDGLRVREVLARGNDTASTLLARFQSTAAELGSDERIELAVVHAHRTLKAVLADVQAGKMWILSTIMRLTLPPACSSTLVASSKNLMLENAKGDSARFFAALGQSQVSAPNFPELAQDLCEYLARDLLSITKLGLHDCQFIGGVDWSSLAGSNVRELDFSCVKGVDGKQLGSALAVCLRAKGLDKLRVAYCDFSNETLAVVGVEVGRIKILELGDYLNDASIKLIALALKSPNSELRELKLWYVNPMASSIENHLVPVWKHPNCNLAKLSFRVYHPMHKEAAKAVEAMFCNRLALFVLLQGRQVKRRHCPLRRLPVEMFRLPRRWDAKRPEAQRPWQLAQQLPQSDPALDAFDRLRFKRIAAEYHDASAVLAEFQSTAASLEPDERIKLEVAYPLKGVELLKDVLADPQASKICALKWWNYYGKDDVNSIIPLLINNCPELASLEVCLKHHSVLDFVSRMLEHPSNKIKVLEMPPNTGDSARFFAALGQNQVSALTLRYSPEFAQGLHEYLARDLLVRAKGLDELCLRDRSFADEALAAAGVEIGRIKRLDLSCITLDNASLELIALVLQSPNNEMKELVLKYAYSAMNGIENHLVPALKHPNCNLAKLSLQAYEPEHEAAAKRVEDMFRKRLALLCRGGR
ncbi:hypothetical protein BASA62_005191 [Batrachochytrium salamandrivorans]|nr:hypothetical protein BASA62_005191 [Batrachochytrium salamandrivorans]